MSGWTLRLRQPPVLRLDLRGATPSALGAMPAHEVERLPLGHGNRLLPLAEFFAVAARNDDSLVFEGDLARCDRIGWQMDGGRLVVDGAAGDYAGGCMSGGEITVWGPAGALAACEMAGGTLTVEGDVGDFAASTLPGRVSPPSDSISSPSRVSSSAVSGAATKMTPDRVAAPTRPPCSSAMGCASRNSRSPACAIQRPATWKPRSGGWRVMP